MLDGLERVTVLDAPKQEKWEDRQRDSITVSTTDIFGGFHKGISVG